MTAEQLVFTPFDAYLARESSSDEVKGPGESVRIHGRDLSVDALYA